VKLTADSTQKFAINEERLWEQSTSVSSLTPDMLFSYVQNKTISDPARRQLQQILDLKRQLAAMDGQISQTEAEVNELTRDQERVRQNLVSLNQVSGQQEQVQVYARQLADQEKLLAGKRDSLSGLRKQRAGLDASVKGAIDKLEF
jgi:chromosome segregation ATPase